MDMNLFNYLLDNPVQYYGGYWNCLMVCVKYAGSQQ